MEKIKSLVKSFWESIKRDFVTKIATLSGAFSVILGAFGAHKLKSVLSPEDLAAFNTGVKY